MILQLACSAARFWRPGPIFGLSLALFGLFVKIVPGLTGVLVAFVGFLGLHLGHPDGGQLLDLDLPPEGVSFPLRLEISPGPWKVSRPLCASFFLFSSDSIVAADRG